MDDNVICTGNEKKRSADSECAEIPDAKRQSPAASDGEGVDVPRSLELPADAKSPIWTPAQFPKPLTGNILLYVVSQSVNTVSMEPLTVFLIPVGCVSDSQWETLLIAKSFIYTIPDQIEDCFTDEEDQKKMTRTFVQGDKIPPSGEALPDGKRPKAKFGPPLLEDFIFEFSDFTIPDSSIPDHKSISFSMVTGYIHD